MISYSPRKFKLDEDEDDIEAQRYDADPTKQGRLCCLDCIRSFVVVSLCINVFIVTIIACLYLGGVEGLIAVDAGY